MPINAFKSREMLHPLSPLLELKVGEYPVYGRSNGGNLMHPFAIAARFALSRVYPLLILKLNETTC